MIKHTLSADEFKAAYKGTIPYVKKKKVAGGPKKSKKGKGTKRGGNAPAVPWKVRTVHMRDVQAVLATHNR